MTCASSFGGFGLVVESEKSKREAEAMGDGRCD